MKRKIYIVRHAEPESCGPDKRCIGITDLDLSAEGRRQAEKLQPWFQSLNVSKIYTSPLKRAVKTAEILGGEGTQIEICDGFQEIHMGNWENLSFREIREQYPKDYEERGRHMGTFRTEGGESFLEAGNRFARTLEVCLSSGSGDLLIVAHAGVIRSFICRLYQISPDQVFQFPQPYASVTVLEASGGEVMPQRIGWRPPEYMDEEEIHRLYRKCRTPDPVIRHMEAVAAYMDTLQKIIDPDQKSYDWKLLRQAALVHDLMRTSRRHAQEGAGVLEKEGYMEAAVLVRDHHSPGKTMETEPLSMEDILFYADKRVKNETIVPLDVRFAGSRKKCRSIEAVRSRKGQMERARQIERKIEKQMGGMWRYGRLLWENH